MKRLCALFFVSLGCLTAAIFLQGLPAVALCAIAAALNIVALTHDVRSVRKAREKNR